ncbi:hypothetical protein [Frigoriglobus tundricola]|uniref:Uncharacterized protein n=1 Tax=Frigoriglobus tundricola TaxID=2774151 RepID=A0A6M5Z1B5_9BACT|nr:hypothetical protein [Frigoriglobus tundricola]QJX00120.1 hypothetical protein FTUN_7744 [Frigoriglobus tundricola]
MRFTIVSIVLITTALVFTGVVQRPARWFAIDSRNRTGEAALRDSNDRRLDLEEQGESSRLRAAVTEDVAARLGEGRLTLYEAIGAIEPLARAAPEWFLSVRRSYQSFALVSPTATDREVIAVYLLQKIDQLADAARERGDTSRATALSARRVELESRAATPAPAQAFRTRTRFGAN